MGFFPLNPLLHPDRYTFKDPAFFPSLDGNVFVLILRSFGSCSQVVDRVKLDWRSELVAVHKQSYDGIVHEHGFRETNGFAG